MPSQLRAQYLRSHILASFFAFALPGVLLAIDPKPKDEWPQWLGPNRDGMSAETGLLKSWPETGPKVVWRKPLGDGYSGISVAQGRVFTLFSQGDDELAICFDAGTGSELWRVRTDSTYKDTNGNGPRSTPTIHDQLAYVIGAKGQLYALQAKDGKAVWHHDLKKEFQTSGPSDGGFSTSPLVEENMLLVEAGGANHAFMAFDKKSGKVLWHAESDSAAFSSPIAVTIDGKRQIIFFSATGAVAVSPKNGQVIWRLPWVTSYNVNATTPLFIPPDRVFISSGYDIGAVMLRLRTDYSPATAEQLWKSKAMQNIWSISIVQGDYLYGFDKGSLKCMNLNSAEEKWAQRGFGVGSLLFADGHLIVLGDKGKLALVEATPEAYREKAGAQIMEGRCITVPALAGGKLYLRNLKEILCVDLVD